MQKLIAFLFLLPAYMNALTSDTSSLNSGRDKEWEESCVHTKHWAVILTTTNYEGALAYAQKASGILGFELNLRGLVPTDSTMLSNTDTCGCGMVHDYYPRGRWDDGNWISIETDGKYYIVVAASGYKDSEEFPPALQTIREHYPDAYVHPRQVWMCCMH